MTKCPVCGGKGFGGHCGACEFKLAADVIARNDADEIEQAVAEYISKVGRELANARMAFQCLERIHHVIHPDSKADAA